MTIKIHTKFKMSILGLLYYKCMKITIQYGDGYNGDNGDRMWKGRCGSENHKEEVGGMIRES